MLDHLSLGVSDLGASAAFTDDALAPVSAPSGLHVAFVAPERAAVEAFHAAATGAGGRDAGAPDLRPHDHENYDAAFVLDPDGDTVGAVCHGPG